MSVCINRITILGNLGGDPEVRSQEDGRSVVIFTVATDESWRDSETGEWRERTEWHRVVVFNSALAKVAEKALKKGARVFIEGQLQKRKWVNDKGEEQLAVEIVLHKNRGALVVVQKANTLDASPEASEAA